MLRVILKMFVFVCLFKWRSEHSKKSDKGYHVFMTGLATRLIPQIKMTTFGGTPIRLLLVCHHTTKVFQILSKTLKIINFQDG